MSHTAMLSNGYPGVGWSACPVCRELLTENGRCSCSGSAPVLSPIATQVGGSHYKDMAIQPAEYILKNNIGWAEGCAIAYLSRWRQKGGVQDLEKARHTIDLLIAEERAKGG